MAVKFALPMRVFVHILYQKINKNFNLVYFTKDKIGPLDRLFSFEKANMVFFYKFKILSGCEVRSANASACSHIVSKI